ncbi:MAG: glycerophosphodiester phosphodiesterase [Pseudomonadota bacterium]
MDATDFPYLQHDGFIAIAHRGGAHQWPENSMRAFESAIDLGYQYIETDVHLTRDGVLLAFHDDVLDRVTDRKGVIAQMDFAEVNKARIDGIEPIPLMADILAAWPNVKFNIDPKSDSAVDPLCDLIAQHNAIHRVCIGSFSSTRILRARERLGPELCTSMGPREVLQLRLASVGLKVGTPRAACAQVSLRHYGIPTADRVMINTAHRFGLQHHVWTIDDRATMEKLIDRGVDAIMTDAPGVLKSVLEDRGLWRN